MASKKKRRKADPDLIEVIKPRKCPYCGVKLVMGICCKKAAARQRRLDKAAGIPSMRDLEKMMLKAIKRGRHA